MVFAYCFLYFRVQRSRFKWDPLHCRSYSDILYCNTASWYSDYIFIDNLDQLFSSGSKRCFQFSDAWKRIGMFFGNIAIIYLLIYSFCLHLEWFVKNYFSVVYVCRIVRELYSLYSQLPAILKEEFGQIHALCAL